MRDASSGKSAKPPAQHPITSKSANAREANKGAAIISTACSRRRGWGGGWHLAICRAVEVGRVNIWDGKIQHPLGEPTAGRQIIIGCRWSTSAFVKVKRLCGVMYVKCASFAFLPAFSCISLVAQIWIFLLLFKCSAPRIRTNVNKVSCCHSVQKKLKKKKKKFCNPQGAQWCPWTVFEGWWMSPLCFGNSSILKSFTSRGIDLRKEHGTLWTRHRRSEKVGAVLRWI